MKNLILILSLLIISMTLFLSNKMDDGPPSASTNIPSVAELPATLIKIYHDADAPGFTLSLVKNDAILYQQAFGKAHIENNKDYTNQTTQPNNKASRASRTFTVGIGFTWY